MEDSGQVSRTIGLSQCCCWRERWSGAAKNQLHITQLETKRITVGLSWETNLKKKASLILEHAAPEAVTHALIILGRPKWTTYHRFISTTTFISSKPVSRLTSRFMNLVSGFHLQLTNALQASITFSPLVADVIPGMFLGNRSTVESLALAAPRVEIPSIGVPGCVREANCCTCPSQDESSGGGSE